MCQNYDLFAVEDIDHLVMQCPFYQVRIGSMYEEIYSRCPNIRNVFENNPAGVFAWLIVKSVTEVDFVEACAMWETS